MKTASDVRASFLDFFRGKGHEIVRSASLVPENDPTLMFVNAGMVPFKDVFTGKDRRSFTRAASSQKCIRISGKHNDLENVGVTARHHTFFEMLGNFSFGDYFKEDAIAFAWELLTKVWDLPQDRLVITVFGGEDGVPADDEARAIWRKVTGFPDELVIGLGKKDNFWSMGDTGPCGPCTEIHFWNGEGDRAAGLPSFLDEPPASGRGWMEIWNLVFMQFERAEKDGPLAPLPRPGVDTGAGLERVTSVLQGKTTNYDTDLLRALVEKAAELAGKPYRGSTADDDVSMRVIADHARTTAFLVAEGVFPDRGEREYVLRRVMRRAIRHGHRLGIARPFLHEVALEVVRLMGDAYPELVERREVIASIAEGEEVRFRETIERGLKILDEEIELCTGRGSREISGGAAFKLYDTYGFPIDLTRVIAEERSFTVDMDAYEAHLAEQKERSLGSKLGDAALDRVWHTVKERLGEDTRFVGYEHEEAGGRVVAIVRGDADVTAAGEGDEVIVLTDQTPFYAESGGQVGDRGRITHESGLSIAISDTQKPVAGLVGHVGKVERGSIEVGALVRLEIDHDARTSTRRNHSATHLLHWALRTVLGEQATQKGSLVGPSRLRFDFSHNRPLAPEEIRRIEDLVNAKVLGDAPVVTEILPIEKARAKGAMAMFGEKYGASVRVLTMTADSIELCGGTHARALGEIGLFKILSDAGVAAGVRRIEATTGMNALDYVRGLESEIAKASLLVRANHGELTEKIEKVLASARAIEKDLEGARRKLAMGGGAAGGGIDEMLRGARDIPGGKVLAVKAEVSDAAMLREMAEKLRDRLGEGAVLVGAANGPKAALVVVVSRGLTDRYKAGDLIRPIAKIVGGSGGGRADMAQAGGTGVERLDEALAAFPALFEQG